MMGKIVPHRDTGSRAPQLHAAPDAFEALERLDGSIHRHARGVRRRDRGQRVLKIVLPLKLHAQRPEGLVASGYLEAPGRGCAGIPARAHAEALDRGPAAAGKDPVYSRIDSI